MNFPIVPYGVLIPFLKGMIDQVNSLKDVIYNWLSIKLVVELRPFDSAARETLSMFEEILLGDFQAKVNTVNLREGFYFVELESNGEEIEFQFPKDYVSMMVRQIENHSEKYQTFQL